MVMKHKAKLRKKMKTNRLGLDSEQAAACSQKITNRCLDSIGWEHVKNLHTYIPITDMREVDTWPLVKAIWEKWPHIRTVVPRLTKDKHLESVVIDLKTKWKEHILGMPEPVDGEVLPDDYQYDVIIVPLLAFDRNGHRLGYGKGFYDRFLSAQQEALSLGLCYHMGFIADGLPHQEHDIPLKRIITEAGTVTFSSKLQNEI